MKEQDILHESAHFWVKKSDAKFEILLKVIGHSYLVGTKYSLDGAKAFIDKMEKYPKNIKNLLPENLRYQVK